MTERIGPVVYDKPLPWRVRLALWIAPELRDEIAHWARQYQRKACLTEAIRDV